MLWPPNPFGLMELYKMSSELYGHLPATALGSIGLRLNRCFRPARKEQNQNMQVVSEGDNNHILKQEEKQNTDVTLDRMDTFARVEQQSSAQCLQVGPADAAHRLRTW